MATINGIPMPSIILYLSIKIPIWTACTPLIMNNQIGIFAQIMNLWQYSHIALRF